MLSDQQVETFIYSLRDSAAKQATAVANLQATLNALQQAVNALPTTTTTTNSGANALDSTPYQGGILHRLVHTFNLAVNFVSTILVTGVATFTSAPIFSSTTATRPLKVNGAKALISALINLASGNDVTGTLPVANGGTAQVTLTNHGVLIGQGTGGVSTTGPSGLAGTVLTSNGSSADPSFQALPASAVTSVNGQTGNVTITAAGIGAAIAGVFGGATVTLAKLTTGGTNGSLTVNTSGQITAYTPPT